MAHNPIMSLVKTGKTNNLNWIYFRHVDLNTENIKKKIKERIC